ncbi:MAG: hypothetical protein HYY16_00220 [Planctomycetes bacterium]|nr:hypothetical protein [Planctomycetota bacterium]
MKKTALFAVALIAACGSAFAQPEKPRTEIIWTRDLNSARALAEKEWRLLVLYFFGDVNGDGDARNHHKHIENLFKSDALKDVTKEFVGVRVSCHTYPDEARKYSITKGPLVVVLSPEGREIIRTFNADEANLRSMFGRVASDYAPTPVEWKASFEAAVNEGRLACGLVLVCAHEKDCKTCQQAQEMLVSRWLVLPRKRITCVKLEKNEDREQLRDLGVSAFPRLLLVRPGKTPKDSYRIVFNKLWPASPRALADCIERELKKLEERR